MKNIGFKCKIIKAFTLVELIISVTITVIILVPLVVFISDISSEINYSNIKTKYISKIYEIDDKISEIKGEYLSGSILINNETGTGSDVILFKTTPGENKKQGYIFALVDYKNLLIDGSGNIDNIGEKYFAYKKVSETELNELETNPNKVYSYKFNLDKTFKGLILKDFQADFYNNNILELKFSSYINYKKGSLVKKYSEVKKNEIEDFILNF